MLELYETIERLPGADLVAARPLPALRRGDHVLGARRDGQGAGSGSSKETTPAEAERKLRDGRRPTPGCESHLRPLVGLGRRRRGRGRHARRGVRRVAAVLRGARRGAAARARLRGPALGGRRPARLRRPPGRLGDARCRCSSSAPPGPSSSTRRPGLGRRQAECADDLALGALRRRHRAPALASCSAPSCRRRRRPSCSRGPAATRSTRRSSRACCATGARSAACRRPSRA